MATLNTAVQAMVDNLHAKMSSDQPLDGTEQTLMASAIDKLSDNVTWERALIAVAEEHLNTATNAMTSSLESATSALSNAETKIVAANDTMQSQNANLALIPTLSSEVQSKLDSFGQSNSTELKSNLSGIARPVLGITDIEAKNSSGNNQRSSAVFAVYDANGESYLARPSYTNSTSQLESNRFEFLKLDKQGAGKTTIAYHYVNSSNFYATPTTFMYYYGCSGILPLATKSDSNDIAYEVIYSLQDSNNTGTPNYAGIYCRSAGYSTVTLPKKDLNATDKFDIATKTSHAWAQAAVLYDNNKHCLVMVENNTSLLVEKYRDGNVLTDVSIADEAALQAYVDSGDFTTVILINNQLSNPKCFRKYQSSETNTSVGQQHDCHGFFGKLGNRLKMGDGSYSCHYRFTADKKLEPLNFVFNSTANSWTTAVQVTGDATLAVSDMQGNTLGIYQYQSKCDQINYTAGNMANVIMCMNPYSHVGILNDFVAYGGTTGYYGISRTCRAF